MDNNTLYYVRSRHKGAKFGLSDWGPTSHFKTKPGLVESSAIVSPVSGTVDLSFQQTFGIAAFSAGTEAVSIQKIENGSVTGYVVANRYRELVSTEWEISTQSDFSTIAFSTTTLGNILTWLVSSLVENTSYYLRVRQNISYVQPVSADAADVVTYSTTPGVTAWSETAIYATAVAFVPRTPFVTSPSSGAVDVYKNVSLVSSAYATDGVAAHQSSDWEISTVSDFSSIAFSLYNSTSSITAATLSGLSAATVYYARVRHRDAAGQVGSYSPAVSFTTMSTFAPAQPTITNITNGVSKLGTSWYPVTSSAFSGKGTDTHASSTWQFSTTSTFNAGTIVSSVTNSVTDKTTFSPVGLANDTTYYARVMHRGADGLDSPWSPVVNFSIVSNSISWTTSGQYSYTVPAGPTQATLDGLAGGGGGGGGRPVSVAAKGGGGGASGQSGSITIPVVEGDVITVTVGIRGTPGIYGTNNGFGGNGGSTVFKKNGVTVLTLTGGLPGSSAAAGAANGTSVAGVFTNTYKGGNGGANPNGGAAGAGGANYGSTGGNAGQGGGGGGSATYLSGSAPSAGYGGYGKATITLT